jgi:hypothetical protein
MNKIKVTYSLVNLFAQTSEEVERVRAGFIAISGTLISYYTVNGNDKLALYVAIGAGVINMLIGGFKITKEEDVQK